MAFPAACRLADSTGTMETMLLHLHLVRHGQTFFNRYNRLQGWSNSPLTDAGLADADKAAAKLRDIEFAAAYCSDTTRAQVTAQRILDANEAAGHVRPSLVSDMHFREQFYGYFEGQDMSVAWTAAGGPHGAKNYNDIVRKYGLRLVEDCAQSHGTLFHGKQSGTFGDIGCFSFYPTKGLGAFGDGGCIVTDDEELAGRCRALRNYGSRVKYHNEAVGANSRLDEIQAGLLHVKLGFLEELNQERREIARRYQEGLDTAFLTLPKVRPGVTSTWHQFVIHSPHRDALKAWLAENGIGSEIHYPIPPHLSEAYRYLGYHEGDFPITEKNAREVLSLPMFNGLREDEQAFVIDTINRFRP